MTRTGRPPLPDEAKRRRGTLRAGRRRASVAVVPLVDVTRTDDGPVGAALVESGAAAWIAVTDAPMVRLAERLWEDVERLRCALDDEFEPKVHAAYMATVRELEICLAKLGFSPSDRARLGVTEALSAPVACDAPGSAPPIRRRRRNRS